MYYNWKINMKNGDKFIVKHTESNSCKFLEMIMGKYATSINIHHFELSSEKSYKYGDNFEYEFKSNQVAILSSDVSSVESLGVYK